MDDSRIRNYLDLFSRVAKVYQKRYAEPLWNKYPNADRSESQSLGVFLEGYAFERRGRPLRFGAAAAHIMSELRDEALPFDASKVWALFCRELGDDKLNIKLNPLAPKGTAYGDGGKKTTQQS